MGAKDTALDAALPQRRHELAAVCRITSGCTARRDAGEPSLDGPDDGRACAAGRAIGIAAAPARAGSIACAATTQPFVLPLPRALHYHRAVPLPQSKCRPTWGLRRCGDGADSESEYSNKVMAMISFGVPRACRALAALALLLGGTAAHANPTPWQLNMTPGVTPISQRIHDVHMLAFWVCVAIGVIVFGAMIYAMVKFRKSNGAVAAKFTHNSTMEAIWTVVPIVILIVMAWPATKLLVDMADVENSDMTVKVTGYQWKWRYTYVDYYKKASGVNFISSLDADSNRVRQLGSGLDPNSVKVGDENTYLLNVDKPLVVPVGVKIRFVITADDVIHAWWVPSLGWKQDAIPGIINDNWTRIDTPGVYRGQCAELCGKDHGFMPIVVKAVPKAEFEQWLATQESAAAADKNAATAQAAPPPATQG